MKISIIGLFPPFKGGISNHNYWLGKELNKLCEVLFVSYTRQYPKFLYGKESQIDKNFNIDKEAEFFKKIDYCIDSINPFTWELAVQKVKKFKPDLVILPWWVIFFAPMYLYMILRFKFLKIKVMFLCHNIFDHENNILKQFFTKIVLKQVNFFQLHTEADKQKLLSFHPKAKIIKHLLPSCGFEKKESEIKKESENTNLLFFGYIRPYKGLDFLLEAISLIKDKKVKLKIIGLFREDKEKYNNLIKKFNIEDKLEIEDKYIDSNMAHKYFIENDLVILPYKNATGSGIIANAYFFNKPVVVTNVGGLPEAVEDEKTGKIVDTDPRSIADGILWFIENKDKIDFEKNIEDFVNKKMSWTSLAEKIIQEI